MRVLDIAGATNARRLYPLAFLSASIPLPAASCSRSRGEAQTALLFLLVRPAAVRWQKPPLAPGWHARAPL